jgi:hypothetical protein
MRRQPRHEIADPVLRRLPAAARKPAVLAIALAVAYVPGLVALAMILADAD